MNREEIRFFKLYASRFTTDERKDLILFDYIRKAGKDYDEEKIFGKLYHGAAKNPFYRLKNRLLSDLNKSLSIQHFEEDENIHAFHLLALARFFSSRNNGVAVQYFLKRAEGKAIAVENFELLDIIYGEFIRLSHELTNVNPETIIQKRRENSSHIRDLRMIDDILAAVTHRLRMTQNLSSTRNPVINLLQKTVNDFTKDRKIVRSHTLRFRLYHAVSQILLQKRDYIALEAYLISVYHEFSREKLFNRNNHDLKLQMLTYLVNALFKNHKTRESLQYAEVLHLAMAEYHHLLYDKYFFYYYNTLVINYSRLDPKKAISILEDLKENKKIKQVSFNLSFVYLNLMLLYFDQGKHREALKYLNKLYLMDGYRNTDISLRFKIALSELVIRYEMNDFDLLEYKIKQVKKEFSEQLKLKEHIGESEFLSILRYMINSASYRHNKKLVEQVKKFLKMHVAESDEDAQIINYRKWILEKFHKTDVVKG